MAKFSKERRDMLKSTCMLAGATALYTIGGSLNVFAAGGNGAQPQPLGAPKRHDSFVYSEGPKKGQDVMTADIVPDAPPITVQAKDSETGQVRDSETSMVLVYRTSSPANFCEDLRPSTFKGIVAYSALCTGEGCHINGWNAEKKLIVGPCEKCIFDPFNGECGAKCTTGRTRELPQVPVGDHEGKLIVADAILEWIGVKRA